MFNDLLNSASMYISSEIKRFLTTPLPSTGKPPHFFFTADKATIGRKSNQAVLIGAVSEGRKVAIPVGAPLVYRTEVEEDGTYHLTGGNSAQLADSIVNQILTKLELPETMLSYLSGECIFEMS